MNQTRNRSKSQTRQQLAREQKIKRVKRMQRIRKAKIAAGLTLCCAGLCMIFLWQNEKQYQETIVPGITVEGIDVSGMNRQEAQKTIAEYVAGLQEREVTITVDRQKESFPVSMLNLSWDDETVLNEAMEQGKTGNLVGDYIARREIKHKGMNYDINLSYQQDWLQEEISTLAAKVEQKPENATVTEQGGKIVITQDVSGRGIDVTSSVEQVMDEVRQATAQEPHINVVIEPQTVEAAVTAESLSGIKDVLGTYTTSYKTSSTARCKNIKTATENINGQILYPGEELSVVNLITPFTEENGYALAGSYMNGEVVDSVGGGVCQVSTTLYNAVLLSELEVTERSSHSMIVNYVKPSMDAAIAEKGNKDLKFRNNTDAPIYIHGAVGGDKTVTFTIYGANERQSNREVSYVSETINTIEPGADKVQTDPTQPVGYTQVQQSAHTGSNACLWKVVTIDGNEVSREKINTSRYKASPRIVVQGTMQVEPVPAETTPETTTTPVAAVTM